MVHVGYSHRDVLLDLDTDATASDVRQEDRSPTTLKHHDQLDCEYTRKTLPWRPRKKETCDFPVTCMGNRETCCFRVVENNGPLSPAAKSRPSSLKVQPSFRQLSNLLTCLQFLRAPEQLEAAHDCKSQKLSCLSPTFPWNRTEGVPMFF